jgi:uncharacterized Zn-finger protein
MSFNPTDDQIEWHMRQLRNWMIPNPMAPAQSTIPHSVDTIPAHFYSQTTYDFYNYDASTMSLATQMPMQRSQTFSDLSELDYDYGSNGYFQSPLTPSSCPPDDLPGMSDDVASCFSSEAPSSLMSSDLTDKNLLGLPLARHPSSVTSQPSTALLQPPSEVDALMKTIQVPTGSTSPSSSSVSSAARVKRHLCTYTDCGKAFSQPTHLKIHLRSHTGEKPYICSIPSCRQAFSQLGNLRTHERRHIGQRPNRKRSSSDPGARSKRYECLLDGCRISSHHSSASSGKVFTQLGNLKAHMNKFHKETLLRLSQHFANTDPTPEDQELRTYFQSLYKNSNKGIKGRGKGRKVEVMVGDELSATP